MDNKYMSLAFELAKKAQDIEEIPVGAVVVKDDEVIGIGYNKRELNNDLFGHAEIMAIKDACNKLDNWRLDNCTIYVTLEPCPMCMEIISAARIKNVFYLLKNNSTKKQTIVCKQNQSLLETKYKELITNFFNKIR